MSSKIPSRSTTSAQGSKTRATDGDGSKQEPNKLTIKKSKKEIDFQLPALSIVGRKRELDFDEIRKKVMRRSNPEGEDKKELANILKNLNLTKPKIKVHEFVNLVSKFTGDNGDTMRQVMEADLASFRRMVTKVYETMTQDVSDVLVNEQIQATSYYQEKYDMLNEKKLWMIGEIFQMIPNFDFERYAKEKNDFLNLVLPLPTLITRDADDIDAQKRQEAFHRLQWLKIEGVRLSQENKRLEKKLHDLLSQQKKDQTEANLKAQIMEERKQQLEDEEAEKKEHLDDLTGALGKSIVRSEAYVRLEEDEAIRVAKPPRKKQASATSARKRTKHPDWPSITAADMEAMAAKDLYRSESARADEKKRTRMKLKVPAEGQEQYMSRDDMSGLPSVSQMQERKIQETTTTVQEKRPLRRGPPQSSKSNCSDTCRGYL